MKIASRPSARCRQRWLASLASWLLVSWISVNEGTLRADTIEVNSGAVLDGKILRLTRDEISIRLKTGGTVSLHKRNCRRLRIHSVGTFEGDELRWLKTLPKTRQERQLDEIRAATPGSGESWRAAPQVREPEPRKPPFRNPPFTKPPVRNLPRKAVPPEDASRNLSPRSAPTLESTPISDPVLNWPAPNPTSPPFEANDLEQPSHWPPAVNNATGPAGPAVLPPPPVATSSPTHEAPFLPARSTTPAVVDREHGFQITPPPAFSPWAQGKTDNVAHAFREPISQASLVLSVYPASSTARDLKELTASAYAAPESGTRILRDEELTRGEPAGSLLEVSSLVGGVRVQQLQAFYGTSEWTVVLTFSATAQEFLPRRAAFLATVRSFRFLAPAK